MIWYFSSFCLADKQADLFAALTASGVKLATSSPASLAALQLGGFLNYFSRQTHVINEWAIVNIWTV